MRKIIRFYNELPILAKATIWFTMCNILQKGISFVTLPVYTRLMTTEQYGVYNVFLSWLEIFEIIATFRLSWGGYVVGLTKFNSDKDGYTSSMQTLSILITAVAYFIYTMIASKVNDFTGLNFSITSIIFAILLFSPAVQFWTQRERSEYRYKAVALVTVLASAFTLIFGVMAALMFSDKAVAVMISRLIVQGLIGIILIWENCHKKFVIYNKTYWKRALFFNVPLLPYYFSVVILHSSDRIIIQNLIGASQAGIYGVAYTVSMCMQLFSQAINQAVQPWMFAKMKSNDVKHISQIINMTLLMIAGLNVVLIALAPELLAIIAPAEYYEAIWIIPPLAASVVVMYFYQHFVNIEFYFEESRLTTIASIGAAVLNIVLNLWLIPCFGYYAAGYTTLISYMLFAIVHYIFMKIVCRKRKYKERIVDMKTMLLILISFFTLSGVLLIGYKIAFLRYIFVFWVLGILFIEKNKIKSIFLRYKKDFKNKE